MIFDPRYFMYIAPALALAAWAQFRLRSTYAQAQRTPANLSGAGAARHILDAAGLYEVGIEQVPGELTDHYDPTAKVLRLSSAVYQSHSAAAVGIAAHEAGHALQHAHAYGPLVIRNAAVPLAAFGSNASLYMLIGGMLFQLPALVFIGIAAFAVVVAFQIINLPVEFDASARAKRLLVDYGIVGSSEMPYVHRVLNAAAWTYVAATLQAVLTLLYYVMQFTGSSDRE